MKVNDDIIGALAIIGNVKKVIESCEPNIFEHMELKEWMVVRVLKAVELFEDEWERISENKRGTIQETSISNEGTIRSDTERF